MGASINQAERELYEQLKVFVMAATDFSQSQKADSQLFITTALLQLLEKEHLTKITVAQVSKRSGVSRTAFYRHFDSLEQVLKRHFQVEIQPLFDMLNENHTQYYKIKAQEAFFQAFEKQLKNAVVSGYEPIIQEVFNEAMAKFYQSEYDEFTASFMAAGVYALWRKWLMMDKPFPLADMHTRLQAVGQALPRKNKENPTVQPHMIQ